MIDFTTDGWILASDLLRFLIVSGAVVVTSFILVVIKTYYRHVRRVKVMTDTKTGKALGLLPSHVWMISFSFLFFMGISVSENIRRFGEPPNYYIPANLVSVPFAMIAMWKIFGYERRKYR